YEFVLAKLAAEDGKYDEALSRIDKVIARHPDNAVLQFERAMILIDAGRPSLAEAELRKVAAAHPDFFDAQRVLGRLLLDRAGNDKQKIDEALLHLEAAFRLNPDDLGTGMAASQILLSIGRTAEAEKVLATLLERAPDQRALNYNYAQVLNKLGRSEESKQYLERAVQVDPTFGPASFGLSQIGQKKYDDAVKSFQALLALPDLPDNLQMLAKTQLAYVDLQKGNYGAAVDEARPLLIFRDKPNTQAIGVALDALKKQKRYGDAVVLLQPLIDRFGSDPVINARYVEMLLRSGDKDRARVAGATQIKLGGRNVIAVSEAYAQTDQYEPALTMLRDGVKIRPGEIDVEFELWELE